MKKFVYGVLLGSILTAGGVSAASFSVDTPSKSMKFFVGGEEKTLADDSQPFINDGSTYVPLRKLVELTKQPVYFNDKTFAVSIGNPTAEIMNTNGEKIGSIVLTQDATGVKAHITATGLTPGKHGFHIHTNAFEGADFKSAGGHFNPTGKKHGLESPDGHHMGDLPNLEVKADGTVDTDVVLSDVTLDSQKENSILGKSFIIHASEDDMKSDPAGNAGDRVAGAVIPQ